MNAVAVDTPCQPDQTVAFDLAMRIILFLLPWVCLGLSGCVSVPLVLEEHADDLAPIVAVDPVR